MLNKTPSVGNLPALSLLHNFWTRHFCPQQFVWSDDTFFFVLAQWGSGTINITKGSSFQIFKAVAGRIHNRPSLNRQPGGVPYWGWRLFSNRFFCLHCLCKTHVKGRPRRFLVVLSSHPLLLLLWCCYNCYCLRWWYCRCCCYCQCCCYCCCFKINRPILRWESWDSLFLLLLLLLF